jgi:hypothetical protein
MDWYLHQPILPNTANTCNLREYQQISTKSSIILFVVVLVREGLGNLGAGKIESFPGVLRQVKGAVA